MPKNPILSRRGFLAGTVAAGVAVQAGRAHAQHDERPNIVVMITDDQRWDALGCAGNPLIHTPHLDALCARGTRFANTFASTAICCSSRASILTGLHTRCHGIETFSQPIEGAAWETTYPALLRQAGYYTGFVGKYGVGRDLPRDQFDYFTGFSGQGKYFLDEAETDHLTSHMGDDALKFFAQAPDNRPFCLSVSFKAAHVQDSDPRQFLYDPELESLYQDAEMPVPEKAAPKHFEALPEFMQHSEGRVRWKKRFATPEMYQRSVKGYYRLVSGVDREAGRIMAALRAQGLDKNTVILFASDQGFFLGEYGLAGKWLQYDESIRMPLIVADPRVADADRAAVREEMAMNIDLCPTILDLAGLTPPPFMQGRSLAPLLEKGAADWRGECFFEHHYANDPGGRVFIPGSEAVRTARWKYVVYDHQDPQYEELFDLNDDPRETRNLAGHPEHRARLNRMRARWRAWTEALADWNRESHWRDPRIDG